MRISLRPYRDGEFLRLLMIGWGPDMPYSAGSGWFQLWVHPWRPRYGYTATKGWLFTFGWVTVDCFQVVS